MTTYPLSPDGIFLTCQGEGPMIGTPMVFIRLAGCSVGCAGCDTDYSVSRRLSSAEIVAEAVRVSFGAQWAFITGGEPTDHDITPITRALWEIGFRVAMVTAGTRPVKRGWKNSGVDWLHVSPHLWDGWVQKDGEVLNVVPMLNGLSLRDMPDLRTGSFAHRYVTPLWGNAESFQQCVQWVRDHPDWRLGIQAHKVWGLP